MTCYQCIQITFGLLVDFLMPFSFFLFVRRLVPTLMALCFYFEATIRRFSVFCLTSNMLVKRHSDFLALGFLTGVFVVVTLGLDRIQGYSI